MKDKLITAVHLAIFALLLTIGNYLFDTSKLSIMLSIILIVLIALEFFRVKYTAYIIVVAIHLHPKLWAIGFHKSKYTEFSFTILFFSLTLAKQVDQLGEEIVKKTDVFDENNKEE